MWFFTVQVQRKDIQPYRARQKRTIWSVSSLFSFTPSHCVCAWKSLIGSMALCYDHKNRYRQAMVISYALCKDLIFGFCWTKTSDSSKIREWSSSEQMGTFVSKKLWHLSWRIDLNEACFECSATQCERFLLSVCVTSVCFCTFVRKINAWRLCFVYPFCDQQACEEKVSRSTNSWNESVQSATDNASDVESFSVHTAAII